MHRLFVALRPPPAMRAGLLAAMGGVSGARWQTDEQLHLTLRFIGEVDRPTAEDVAAALHSIHGPAPLVAIEGVGTFERKGRPTSLWAGVPRTPALDRLQGSIDRAIQRVGLEPERRTFLPHVTLARMPQTAGPASPWLAATTALRITAAPFGHVILYESRLDAAGASYEAIARYPLA